MYFLQFTNMVVSICLCFNMHPNILSNRTIFFQFHLPGTWGSVNIALESDFIECKVTKCVTYDLRQVIDVLCASVSPPVKWR